MKTLSLFFACVSLALFVGTAEASITITDCYALAHADDAVGGYAEQIFTGTTIPTHTTLNAIGGGSYSKNAIDWYESGGQTILSFGMDHQRTGTLYSQAYGYVGNLYFTAIFNEPYELSGYYNVADAGAAGSVSIFAGLRDQNSALDLFENQQNSQHTLNEQLTLGGLGSDNYAHLTGSLTGNLIAGHKYRLNAYGSISAYPGGGSGASALGNITLKIGTAAVPEPSALVFWGGLLLLGAVVQIARRLKSSNG